MYKLLMTTCVVWFHNLCHSLSFVWYINNKLSLNIVIITNNNH